MLRHEIVTEVQDLVEDPEWWTAARITTLANRAIRELCNHFGVAVGGHYEFDSVVDQQTYQLPNDWVAPNLLYYGDSYTEIPYVGTKPQTVYGVYADVMTSGEPEKYFIWPVEDRPEMWFYPVFGAVYTCYLFYWRRPPNIVLDNDEPLLPLDWHTYIVDYVERRTWIQDEKRNWSPLSFDGWWNMLKQQIQVSEVEKSVAGRSLEFGVFDDQFPRISTEFSSMFRDSAANARVP